MIEGIGTDITTVLRFERLVGKSKFINKILTLKEKEMLNLKPVHCRANFLAKRFAAKEAFSKALGCGIGRKFKGILVTFKSIEVDYNKNGAPVLHIVDNNLSSQIGSSFLSISNEGATVLAFCIITQKKLT